MAAKHEPGRAVWTRALVALATFIIFASIFWVIGLQTAITVVLFDVLLVGTIVSYWCDWPKLPPKGYRKLKRELDEDIKRFEETGKM